MDGWDIAGFSGRSLAVGAATLCGFALLSAGCASRDARLSAARAAVNPFPTAASATASTGDTLPTDPALDALTGNRPRTGSALSTASNAASTGLAASGTHPVTVDPRVLHDVMEEVRAAGAIHPSVQAHLLDDLDHTNPALWPQLLETHRASIAYQRRITNPAMPVPAGDGNVGPIAPTVAFGLASAAGSAPFDRAPFDRAMATTPAGDATHAGNAPVPAGLASSRPAPGAVIDIPGAVQANQWALDTGTDPAREPLRMMATDARPIANSAAFAAPGTTFPLGQQTGDVRQVALVTPTSSAEHGSLAAAIQTLEAQAQQPAKDDAGAATQANLRLLYLVAGRREDALRPIAGLNAAEQEYWDKQLRGLATWLDVERIPDPSRRAAEAHQCLGEAVQSLSQLGSLVVRQMAFCTEVSSYGVFTRFKNNTFVPGQQVLLYAEVENFKSVETHKGYHTALRSSYQIIDSQGHRVAAESPQLVEEYCQNPRRDYFVRYRLHLPTPLPPGEYTLRLTIEDTLGNKVGESSIAFDAERP